MWRSIYRLVPEMSARLVEVGADQRRERFVIHLIVVANCSKDFFTIRALVGVILPLVYAITAAVQVHGLHGLAKDGEGVAGMGAQVDYRARSKGIGQPKPKWGVFEPLRFRPHPDWCPE